MKKLSALFIITLLFTYCSISDAPSKSSDAGSKVSDSVKSISKSIQVISKSIASLFRSSSRGGKKSARAAFQADVRLATVLHMQSGNQDNFAYDLSRIAFSHGFTNWKSEEITYIAIGQGLKKSGVDRSRLQQIGLDNDRKIYNLIEKGYDTF